MEVIEYEIISDELKHPKLHAKRKFKYEDDLSTYENMVDMLDKNFNICKQYEEHMYVLGYNNAMHLLGVYEVGHGSSVQVCARLKEIMIFILLTGSDVMILVHNHPSGKLDVSVCDMDITNTARTVSNLLSIYFDEHIIISSKGYKLILDGDEFEFV